MVERAVEAALVRRVKGLGGIAYKCISPGHAGMPDRLVVLPGGRVVFVELKRDDGKGRLSARQRKESERLSALGCDVQVVQSAEEARRFI